MDGTTSASIHPFLTGAPKGLFINGVSAAAASGATFDTVNPANGQVLAQVARGGAEDIDAAVAAARKALEGPWAKFGPYQRQRVLLKLADLFEKEQTQLAALDSLDMGGPIKRLGLQMKGIVSMIRWYSAQARAIHGDTIENSMPNDLFSYTLKEPVGVVGAIIPWNGPLAAAVWKLGPVLATGCTVVLKPAEESPLGALRLAELCMEAGVPEGVVNVVTGYGEAGAALAAHPGVDKVAFTGSTAVGQEIIRASAGNVKRLSLELGGKSPNIVFADADMKGAVAGAAMAVFSNSGQICSAGSRLLVERSIYDEFVQKVADVGAKLKVGDPQHPETELGPLVSAQQLDRVVGYMALGPQEGARLLTGGARIEDEGLKDGYFVRPTVFADVNHEMRISREEIFGPVLCAEPFDTLEEAASRANRTEFGLGSGVWTRDVGRVHKLARMIKAGSVWVNCYQAMDPAVPFGGYKMSGYGREFGTEQLNDYLNTKSVWIRTP